MGEQLFHEALLLLDVDTMKSSLAQGPRYRKAFTTLPTGEDAVTFFDMQRMLTIYREFLSDLPGMMEPGEPANVEQNITTTSNTPELRAAEPAENDPAVWVKGIVGVGNRLLDAVGIIDYIVTVESTDDHSVHTEMLTVLVEDAQQQPIYPMLAADSLMTDYDRFLPAETLSFSVMSGPDLPALYKFLLDTVREFGPLGEQALEQWAAIQEQIGCNIERDILSWLEGDMTSVTLEGGAGSVFLVSVTDETLAREKITAAVEFLTSNIDEIAAENPALAMLTTLQLPLNDDRLEGFKQLKFMKIPQPIVWGVADEHLIFGSSPDAVARCLATAAGTHPGIRQNERIMREAILPDGSFDTVALTDQRNLGADLAEMTGMFSVGSGMMGAFIPDEGARHAMMTITKMLTKLTPVMRKLDFYKSSAYCTTFDGQVYRTHLVTHYLTPAERSAKSAPVQAAP